jgi:hypothetical protein
MKKSMNEQTQKLPKIQKKRGSFNTVEEVSQHKTTIANKLLTKIKNIDEFFHPNGIRK